MPRARVVTVSRPALRWYGGKFLLAPWIISLFPPHRNYVEPFGGAASVLLRKPRSRAEIYNDLDDDVVNLFRVLRNEKLAAKLIEQLRLTPFARTEFMDAYPVVEDPIERARRLVILSFMGFGSNAHRRALTGFRADSNRSGTTPAQDWRNYPDCLAAIVDRLRGVVIEHRSAFDIIPKHDTPQTLFYLDPPYVQHTRQRGGQRQAQYAHELSDDDHAKLLTLARGVRGMVVLSGYDTDLYRDMLPDWERVEKQAYADGARDRLEICWCNPAATDAAKRQGRLQLVDG